MGIETAHVGIETFGTFSSANKRAYARATYVAELSRARATYVAKLALRVRERNARDSRSYCCVFLVIQSLVSLWYVRCMPPMCTVTGYAPDRYTALVESFELVVAFRKAGKKR